MNLAKGDVCVNVIAVGIDSDIDSPHQPPRRAKHNTGTCSFV